MEYWERLRGLREDRDLTQAEVAEYLHMAQNTYSRYERGKREIPVNALVKLCRFYQVSMDEVVGLVEWRK